MNRRNVLSSFLGLPFVDRLMGKPKTETKEQAALYIEPAIKVFYLRIDPLPDMKFTMNGTVWYGSGFYYHLHSRLVSADNFDRGVEAIEKDPWFGKWATPTCMDKNGVCIRPTLKQLLDGRVGANPPLFRRDVDQYVNYMKRTLGESLTSQ